MKPAGLCDYRVSGKGLNEEEMYFSQQYADGEMPEYEDAVRVTEEFCLSEQMIVDELSAGIMICGCGEFMSYRDVFRFDGLVLNPVIELLCCLNRAVPERARMAADKIIEILRGIETDDDSFPEPEIAAVREAADLV